LTAIVMQGMSSMVERLGARPPGVIEDVSPRDPFFSADNAEQYFGSAVHALGRIQLALLSAGRSEVGSVLDFACGYGRVLRMLKAAFPAARLTASDVERDAVDFCAETFGATPVYSSADPGEIEIGDRFDLIWSGSFFTHIDESGWSRFLPFLASLLNPDGVLVFTTAGRNVATRMREGEHAGLSEEAVGELIESYDRTGFGFGSYPGRDGYGLSRATPAWVCSRVESTPGILLLGYSESRGGSLERQDFVSCHSPTPIGNTAMGADPVRPAD
jgi:SAM-dependent methyltransferase